MVDKTVVSGLTRRALCASVFATVLPRPGSADGDVIRLLVAFPAGGPVDLIARLFGDQLARELGRSVIIENKPGANGQLAAAETLRAAPDGNTLWVSSVGAVAINPALYSKLNYDMTRDFAPVSKLSDNVEIFCVNPKNPANTLAEFVAATKAKAEATPIGSSGMGSMPHLALEELALATGAKLQHVPYKGVSLVINDVIGDHITGVFLDVAVASGFLRGGQLKALGIGAPQRSPLFPEVKTFDEQGVPNVDTNNWYGLFASAKTPPATVAALNAATRAALSSKNLSDKMSGLGSDPSPSTPDELAALLKHDTEKWAALVRAKGITIEQ